jgi:enoyl-CoA hydratase/carnithine racemase
VSAPGVLVERRDDGVLHLRLDRPARRNALDGALVAALAAAVDDVGDARAVVLGSSTRGIFSAGADLAMADRDRAAMSEALYALYGSVAAAPVPFVAALDGAAVGGGAQLAVACDVRVAGPSARLRFVGPGHGLAVGAWVLPSLVGRGRAMELCLTMRWVEAEEALRIGLVERVTEDPEAEALALAAGFAQLDPAAVAHVKAVAAVASAHGPALEEERRVNRPWTGAMGGG